MHPLDCSGFTEVYVKNDNGEYSKVDVMLEVKSICDQKYNDNVCDNMLDSGMLTVTMKKQSVRKLMRQIRSMINNTRRKRRTYFRHKEKLRRKLLKVAN